MCTTGHDCNGPKIVWPKQCNYGYESNLSVNGRCDECRAFSYCSKNKQKSDEADTFKCPSGYVCKGGANHQYMNIDKDSTGQAYFTDNDGSVVTVVKNYLCPAGHFCDMTTIASPPADLTAELAVKCAAGTYRSAIGGTT